MSARTFGIAWMIPIALTGAGPVRLAQAHETPVSAKPAKPPALKPACHLELPKRAIRFIKRHRIARMDKLTVGKTLFIVPLHDSPEAMPSMLMAGEVIQASFLATVLGHALPKLRIVNQAEYRGLAEPGRSRVMSLDIKDTAEMGLEPHVDPRRVVEMAVLKAANCLPAQIDPRALRRQLSWPKLKTASIYVNSEMLHLPDADSERSPGLFRVLDKMGQLGNEVSVFSTVTMARPARRLSDEGLEPVEDINALFADHGRAALDQIARLDASVFPQDITTPNVPMRHITKLSRVVAQQDTVLPGTFVFNDTIGLMPYVHALADASLIVGPINFFEALYTGTPTTLLMNDRVRRRYKQPVMGDLIDTGRQFPNFSTIDSLGKMKRDASSSDSRNRNYPAAPLDKLLDDTARVLERQL